MHVTLFDGSCTVLTAELTTPKSTAPKPVSTLVIPPITGSEKEKKCYSVRSSDTHFYKKLHREGITWAKGMCRP